MPQDPNKEIAKELDEALSSLGVSPDQKKKMGEDLAAAIYLNLLDRLYNELPLDKKEGFMENIPDDPGKVVLYFGNFVAPEKVGELSRTAARDVLDRFIDKVSKS